jgi:para-aminobenzoate synthetase/4-amino-4-deoxychorismate lyase
MKLIRQLETEPRGVYTGAIGFVAPQGATGPSASFSVGIRTVVIDAESGEAEYGVGGGVTFDSDPGAEYEEAALKSLILTHGRSDFELIETMRWDPDSGWFWLDLHLDRLESSARYFEVPIQRDLLVERLEAEVGGGRALRVRVAVDRGGLVDIFAETLPDEVKEPVVVEVDTEAVDSSNPFLYHKTTRREVYETRLARHRRADDVLMVNERGELTEATIANLAVKLDGQWCTPPVDAGCLPGIYRHVLLEQGDLVERTIRPSDLEVCEGLALVNSVRLWREALLADDR